MDWLDLASGALEVPAPAKADVDAAKKASAENFFIAGGRISPQEWCALSDDSRKILVSAAVAVENDRAALLAREILRLQANPGEVLAQGAPSV